MANMFDFFSKLVGSLVPSDPNQRTPMDERGPTLPGQYYRTPAIVPREPNTRLLRPVGQPSLNPTADSYSGGVVPGTGSDPNVDPTATTAVRPRLVSSPPPSPVYVDPAQQRLQLAQHQTAGYLDTTGPAVYGKDGKQISGKPVNTEHGALGRIGDILRQAVISASEQYNNTQGTPAEKLEAAIGGGVAGGFGGGFKPTLDEDRQRLYDINRSMQNEQVLGNQVATNQEQHLRNAQIGEIAAEPDLKWAQIRADAMKNQGDAAAKYRGDLLDQLKLQVNSGGYNPEVHKQLREDLAKVGINADTPLNQSDKFFSTVLPNGGIAVTNERTGKVGMGLNGQTFQKQADVTEGDIKDDRFPFLMSPEDVKRKALSSMTADDQKSLALSDEAKRYLANIQSKNDDGGWVQKYIGLDGKIDEPTVAQDLSTGVLTLPSGVQLFQNDNAAKIVQAKLAAKEQSLADSQKAPAAEVSRFRMLLKGKPVATADDAIRYFNMAMQEPNTKKRQAALEEIYKQLK